MNIPTILIYILSFPLFFLLAQIRAGLYTIYVWQWREYRPDRLWAHLQTKQGRRWMFSLFGITKWIQIAAFISIPSLTRGLTNKQIDSFVLPFAEFVLYTILTVFVVESFLFLRSIVRKQIKVPIWTLKTIIIFLLFLGIEVLFIYPLFGHRKNFPFLWDPFFAIFFIFFDKLRPIIIALFVLASNSISWLWYRLVIFRAKKKMQQFPKPIKIGITGSFGKTSTKEFLATLLETKYKVVKTPAMVNTDIGVAQTILKSVSNNTEVFIAEMGAYKRGEITDITNIVNPSIGIITGINEQHIELFGSIENTKRAKYELIGSLPSGGVAIFNNDNAHVAEMISWTRKRDDLTIVTYGLNKNASVHADGIVVEPEKVSFVLQYGKQRVKVAVPLIGKQHIYNILAAAATALQLGLSLEEIKKGMSRIKAPSMTMAKAGYCNGALLVDDTFNANPEGIKAAVEYMRIAKGKKILVLTPLIELGDEAGHIHEELGRFASGICDYIFVTNGNYKANFLKGISTAKQARVIFASYTQMAQKLKGVLGKDDVAVFEGKEAGNVLKLLQSYV